MGVGERTILVVDDQATVLYTYQRLLRRRLTADVRTAENAQEALAELGRGPVDLVLSDYWMPGMDGIAFLSEVRRRHPGIRRVLFSAHIEPPLAQEALDSGVAEAVVPKDLDPALFVERLRGLLP